MVFPFAGSSYDSNLSEFFLLQKVNGFGLVVRFLVGYLMYNRGEKFFIFGGKRIAVTWNEDLCTSGYVGYGGVGETTEWNRKTPRGQFSFTYAFGILPNPGTELSYTQVDDTYYWVDDVNSRYYNQFVTTKTTPKAWNFPADAFLFRKTR